MCRMAALGARLRRMGLSLILAGVAIGLVLNASAGPRGARDLIVLRADRMALEAQLRRLTRDNADLGTIVQKLRSDDRYIERTIRRELGFTRSDELVYRFGDAADGER